MHVAIWSALGVAVMAIARWVIKDRRRGWTRSVSLAAAGGLIGAIAGGSDDSMDAGDIVRVGVSMIVAIAALLAVEWVLETRRANQRAARRRPQRNGPRTPT
jgi:drug/metabolite transporter (DMT)-like permease